MLYSYLKIIFERIIKRECTYNMVSDFENTSYTDISKKKIYSQVPVILAT
jgi:hypothetical protein